MRSSYATKSELATTIPHEIVHHKLCDVLYVGGGLVFYCRMRAQNLVKKAFFRHVDAEAQHVGMLKVAADKAVDISYFDASSVDKIPLFDAKTLSCDFVVAGLFLFFIIHFHFSFVIFFFFIVPQANRLHSFLKHIKF